MYIYNIHKLVAGSSEADSASFQLEGYKPTTSCTDISAFPRAGLSGAFACAGARQVQAAQADALGNACLLSLLEVAFGPGCIPFQNDGLANSGIRSLMCTGLDGTRGLWLPGQRLQVSRRCPGRAEGQSWFRGQRLALANAVSNLQHGFCASSLLIAWRCCCDLQLCPALCLHVFKTLWVSRQEKSPLFYQSTKSLLHSASVTFTRGPWLPRWAPALNFAKKNDGVWSWDFGSDPS